MSGLLRGGTTSMNSNSDAISSGRFSIGVPVSVQLRRRGMLRIIDAVRLLPILGMFLFAIPLLWSKEGELGLPTSRAVLYLFGVWTILIAISATLSRRLSRAEPARGPDAPDA